MSGWTLHDVWRNSVIFAKMSTTDHDLRAMERRLRDSGPPLYPTPKEQAAIEILGRGLINRGDK